MIRKNRPWTPDEERKLDELLDAGKEAAEIAVLLNRTRQAVYARLQRRYRKQARQPRPGELGLKAKTK
jgi:IS30 family transposase